VHHTRPVHCLVVSAPPPPRVCFAVPRDRDQQPRHNADSRGAGIRESALTRNMSSVRIPVSGVLPLPCREIMFLSRCA
jgi:hypothetical protein